MTNSPIERTPVDLTDASPLSSQALGHWAEPLSTFEPETVDEDVANAIAIRRFATWKKLLRNPFFDIGGVIILTVSLLAILAPLLQRYSPLAIDINTLNKNPSPAHFMGTDYLGRDMWSRLIWGGRTSLPAAGMVVVLSLSIGVVWGILAGVGTRIIDDLLMRLVDVILAFPGLVLAYTIIAFMGSGTVSVVVALAIAGIPGYARVARASTLSAKTTEYVQASIAQGAGQIHIMRRHILPNILDPLVILATLNLAGAILATSALSYLGIGTQLPAADWGTMLAAGWSHVFISWAQVVFPAVFIVLTAFGINLVGDAFGSTLNPKAQGL